MAEVGVEVEAGAGFGVGVGVGVEVEVEAGAEVEFAVRAVGDEAIAENRSTTSPDPASIYAPWS